MNISVILKITLITIFCNVDVSVFIAVIILMLGLHVYFDLSLQHVKQLICFPAVFTIICKKINNKVVTSFVNFKLFSKSFKIRNQDLIIYKAFSNNFKYEYPWSYDGSFQEAIKKIIIMAQCFGVLPVIGVTSKSPSNMRFSWLSFRTIYSIVAFIATGFYTAIVVHYSLSSKIEFVKVVPVINYTSNFYILYAFIKLAKKWPALMEEWKKAEMSFSPSQNIQVKRYLKKKIYIVIIGVMGYCLGSQKDCVGWKVFQENRKLTFSKNKNYKVRQFKFIRFYIEENFKMFFELCWMCDCNLAIRIL
uniref:Uncharacterized protein n=1 Tax=Phlebotomus papatasi TaxID=29031 RepID=A0A240SYM1_PHLPP